MVDFASRASSRVSKRFPACHAVGVERVSEVRLPVFLADRPSSLADPPLSPGRMSRIIGLFEAAQQRVTEHKPRS